LKSSEIVDFLQLTAELLIGAAGDPKKPHPCILDGAKIILAPKSQGNFRAKQLSVGNLRRKK